MQPSLEKLAKFFKLEIERGYDNRAVVGGLEKILPGWEAQARLDPLPEDQVQAVLRCLRQYAGLEPEQRAESIRALWADLFPDQPLREPARPASAPEAPRAAAPREQRAPREEPQPEDADDGAPLPVPPRSLRRTLQPHAEDNLGLGAPLTVLPGIGPKIAQSLKALDLHTLGDLLYYFPRRYDDYSQLRTINRLWYGEVVTVIGQVQSIVSRPIRGGHTHVIEAVVSDETGGLRVTWFNQPWLVNKLKPGSFVSLSGKIDQYLGRLVMNSPEWEFVEREHINTNRIVPVYSLTARVTQNWLRRVTRPTVEYWAPRVPDYLPQSVRQAAGLVDLPTALREIHFPASMDELRAARDRLAFDEIFLLQLGVLRQKRTWKEVTAQAFTVDDGWLQARLAALPYALTGAQQRAVAEIRADLASGQPMNRLLQGDVGSGKTVVAALAVEMVVRGGAQAAIMAPTSILAEQHYRSLTRLLCAVPEDGAALPEDALQPDHIRLLVGDTSEADKRVIREGLADGSIRVVIGTHALLEGPVTFQRLQLAVVDEQHRFGVQQRALLRAKGENPHLLVMTATPIPRSLALTVYGDLDLSVMDEMPAGRRPVETHVLLPRERERAYTMIRSQVEQGYQAFIIYPLVEQGDKDEAKAAVEEHARLQREVFPRLKLGLLHGRMKPDEKEAVMAAFRDGQAHILVSTSVVEVGVDVPNATLMIIEGANRFGLAQLHQFRGRVGRGEAQSYCLLIPEDENDAENARLTVMAESNDGFVLAQRDLEQRGPGEFLGTRQSGYAELRLANLTDVRLIEKARALAQTLFTQDPNLEQPEHQALSQTLRRFWSGGKGDIS